LILINIKFMKQCEYCAEEVRVDAKKCRHCGEWFQKNDEQDEIEQEEIQSEKQIKKPEGFGGWLLLFGLGIFITPIYILFLIIIDSHLYDNLGIFFNILIILGYIWLNYLIIKRKRVLKKWFLIIGITQIILVGIIAIIANSESHLYSQAELLDINTSFFQMVFYVTIWSLYLWKSRRVKNTFINEFVKNKKNNDISQKVENVKKYCHNCGSKINLVNNFCDSCGERVSFKKYPRNKWKKVFFISLGVSIVVISLIIVLIFYYSSRGDVDNNFTYSEKHNNEDYSYDEEDNNKDDSFYSFIEIFNPWIEPVGYFFEPNLFDSDYLSYEEWASYIEYYEAENKISSNKEPSGQFPNKKEVFSSVVKVVCKENDSDYFYTGSGTNLDKNGYVLTNLHIVNNMDSCMVGFSDPISGLIKEIYWATPIIDKDNITGHDLAYLSIEEPVFDDEYNVYGYYNKFDNGLFPYFEIREECFEPIVLGSSIFVVGYPSLSGGALTITDGLVSSLYSSNGYIITSAKISSGNSGGLAIDKKGCFVGVPTAVYYEEGEEYFGEIIDAEFVYEFDEAIEDDMKDYINS